MVARYLGGASVKAVAEEFGLTPATMRRRLERVVELRAPGPVPRPKGMCSVLGCDRAEYAFGMCDMHRRRVIKNGAPGPAASRFNPGQLCSGPECAREAHAGGLCGGHLQQSYRGAALSPLRPSIRSTTRNADGHKRCSQCFDWRPVDQFYPTPGRGNTDGLQSYCMRCDRSMRLLRQYGITGAQFDAMLVAQNGVCAICCEPPPEGAASFSVDHDHACCATRKLSCGKCVRGLLCPDCNRAIGMFNDDPKILMRAAEYLGG